jgi:dihydroorotate dehydrogenase
VLDSDHLAGLDEAEVRVIDWFDLARPVLHRLDPERSHNLTLYALAAGLVPRQPPGSDAVLGTRLFGHEIPNPVGLAAGFDKNARVFHRMFDQGFGWVEVGGVTPRPQPGNPRPRLFRLAADEAVINRMGFNNDGAAVIASRLAARPQPGRLLGVNLASNSDSAAPAEDFEQLVERFARLADYLVIDVSCPNTRNGRVFQDPAALADLLDRLKAVRAAQAAGCALVAKIAPDLTPAELQAIVAVILRAGIDGLIVGNTTIARPAGLRAADRAEAGGLSGAPLLAPSTELLRAVYRLTEGKLTLIGTGGVASGADAYAKIRAGASAVQLYSALVYRGPALVTAIKRDLARLLRADGFDSVAEAVGADHRAADLPARRRA